MKEQESILKIRVLRGGTQGAEVTFTKNEIKSKMAFENTITKKFRWAVQGQFKKDMEALGPLTAKALEIKNLKELIGIEFELKPAGYVLKAQKLYWIGSKTYVADFTSIPITPEHELWEEVETLCDKLCNHMKEYGSTETKVDTRQMVMDMVSEGKLKLPDELKDAKIEDITDEDILNRFKVALEKKGVVIIDATEQTEIVDEEEGFVEETKEKPVRMLKTATA